MSAFDEFVNDEDKHEETTQEEAETKVPQAEEMADTQEPEESGAEQEEPTEAEEEPEYANIDEELFDKANKAARLLRNRRAALKDEQNDKAGKPSLLVRALKLLTLKPKMEQKEMADVLGVTLHELDAVLADAEKRDLVARLHSRTVKRGAKTSRRLDRHALDIRDNELIAAGRNNSIHLGGIDEAFVCAQGDHKARTQAHQRLGAADVGTLVHQRHDLAMDAGAIGLDRRHAKARVEGAALGHGEQADGVQGDEVVTQKRE